ncbi:MAG: homocysteine S-methyltransferase family protein [Lachnospiraceae bacterium]|nr:homocysteine S-methyltransferase family protein [Lachnospiraceae bacterium]
MTRKEFQALTDKGTVLLDGGTGSCLRSMGMPAGVCTEQWVYEHPDAIKKLQTEYASAGSQIIYAPTFGANRISLENMGLKGRTEELNRTLAARTVEHLSGHVFVAGDMSTTGKPMEPYGPMTYDGLMDVYKEQIVFLAESGVDLLVAETLMSQEEALVICDAARAVCDLPLLISFTCEGDGNLYFGGTVAEAAAALDAMGADAVGVNCSVGPDQLEAVIRRLKDTVSIPIMAKPNAGMPVITETGEAVYSMGAEEFAGHVLHLKDCGASLIGGCCGTTPEYIRKIKKSL